MYPARPKRLSLQSVASWASADDLISPCPSIASPSIASPDTTPRQDLSCAALSEPECRALWTCMLALHAQHGCYRSARMAVVVDGDETDMMPSRACLDLLNDSIDHSLLPDAGWAQLCRVAPLGAHGESKRRWWRWSLR